MGFIFTLIAFIGSCFIDLHFYVGIGVGAALGWPLIKKYLSWAAAKAKTVKI